MFHNLKLFALFASVIALNSAAARADFIAYDNASGVGGLQSYGNNLGLDFDVPAGKVVTVTALGVFNDGVLANLNGVAGGTGTDVAIYDRNNSGAPYSVVVHFDSGANAGTQINGNAFQSISPLLLPPGQYSIVGFNVHNYNSNGFPNTTSFMDPGFGNTISFVGGGRFSGAAAAIAFPGGIDGGPANRYNAGTFQYVPEPSSLMLVGVAMLGLLGFRQRVR